VVFDKKALGFNLHLLPKCLALLRSIFCAFFLELSIIIIIIFAPGAFPANGEAASAGGAIGGLILVIQLSCKVKFYHKISFLFGYEMQNYPLRGWIKRIFYEKVL